ncbi:unnamed protein product, partial [marine sediment metagenome]
PDRNRGWRTRYVNAYTARLFSAISLPDPVLASRTIVVPLIRTTDRKKAWCGKCLHLGLSGGNGCMRMMGKCKNDRRSAPYGPGGSAGPDENAFWRPFPEIIGGGCWTFERS